MSTTSIEMEPELQVSKTNKFYGICTTGPEHKRQGLSVTIDDSPDGSLIICNYNNNEIDGSHIEVCNGKILSSAPRKRLTARIYDDKSVRVMQYRNNTPQTSIWIAPNRNSVTFHEFNTEGKPGVAKLIYANGIKVAGEFTYFPEGICRVQPLNMPKEGNPGHYHYVAQFSGGIQNRPAQWRTLIQSHL